jgi:hypothetical protein
MVTSWLEEQFFMSSLHLAQALLLSAALGASMFLIWNAGTSLLFFVADTHLS